MISESDMTFLIREEVNFMKLNTQNRNYIRVLCSPGLTPPTICHMSCVTCRIFFLDKVVELVCEGSALVAIRSLFRDPGPFKDLFANVGPFGGFHFFEKVLISSILSV